jgi:structure-specific recognition protein 1
MRAAADAVDSYKRMIAAQAAVKPEAPAAPEDPKDVLKRKRAEKKAKKDPNAPKRPMSGFLDFQNEVREKYKQDHPDVTGHELSKMMGADWQKMDAAHKDVRLLLCHLLA